MCLDITVLTQSALTWSLVSSPLDQTVGVRTLAGDIMLCSWAKHFTLTVPPSIQAYKWVPINVMLRSNPGLATHPQGSRNHPGLLHTTESGFY